MTPADIAELMKLNGWRQSDLADKIPVAQSTVCRWLVGSRLPSGAAQNLLRQWLTEARTKPQAKKASGTKRGRAKAGDPVLAAA